MKAYIIPLLLLFNTSIFAQSNTTKQLQNTYKDNSFTYLYGSVIRASANLSNNNALLEVIKDVDLIIYSNLDLKSEAYAQQEFNDVIDALKKEKFEQLLIIKEGQSLQKIQSIFDDIAILTYKNDYDYMKLFLTMRLKNKITIVDINGNLKREKITPKDVSALLSLFKDLNEYDLFDLKQGNDDAKNKKSN